MFPIKNLDEIPTPEQAPEPAPVLEPLTAPEPTKHKTSRLKMG